MKIQPPSSFNSGNGKGLVLSMSPLTGFAILFGLFLLMFCLVSGVGSFLMTKMEHNLSGAVRVVTLLQDVFVFIFPALITALLMTRLPARFLYIEKSPGLWSALLGIAVLYASMPWLNCVIEWNNNITFPQGWESVEEALRTAEEEAQTFINKILAGASFGSMLVSVAIIGVMAGLSEELFFRGAMLRLFSLTRMNHHVAIWLVAFLFSLMHFQFFGFVPRLLLGAYFGYLVWWTKCLWVPVIVHAVNNSTVVVAQWATGGEAEENLMNSIGTTPDGLVLVIISLILTVGGLYLLRRTSIAEQ